MKRSVSVAVLVLAAGCSSGHRTGGASAAVASTSATPAATAAPTAASTPAPAANVGLPLPAPPRTGAAPSLPSAPPKPVGTTTPTAPPATPSATTPAATPAPALPTASATSAGPKLALPVRPASAPTGREFLTRTASLPRLGVNSREAAIESAISSGDVPSFLRTFVPVTLSIPGHTATVWVLPDYLAIGTDSDLVRIPMGAPTAQRIADKTGCVLPTKKLVDAIYAQAKIKIAPKPIPPSSAMMSNDYFRRHADMVDAQLVGKKLGVLVAGHKKDVIVSNLIQQKAGRVVIYGWHQLTGVPIQPKSNVHEATYADYSHGVRLVHRTMQVDGKDVLVTDVLKDPVLSKLISDEGVVAKPRY